MPNPRNYDDLQRRVGTLAHEVSFHKQLTRQMEEEIQGLRSLVELACLSRADRDLDGNLHLFADRARELLGSDVVCVALLDKPGGRLDLGVWAQAMGEDFEKPSFPVRLAGTGGGVLKTGEAVLLDGGIGQDHEDILLNHFMSGAMAASAMVAPINKEAECPGLVYAFRASGPPFNRIQLNLLVLVGRLIGYEVDRRAAEAKLKESEERFRFMAETTGDVLYRLRYDSMQYDYLSPSIQGLTGYDQDEIQAIGLSRVLVRVDVPGHENVPLEFIRSNRLKGKVGEYRADYLIRTKWGGHKWIRDHSFPWLDAGSCVIGSVGILSDVSDYKRAEARVQQCTEDLIESEEKYRTLVENVPLVVYRMGPRQEILFLNQFFQEVFGYGSLELFQDPARWTEMVYADDRERIIGLRNQCYEEGREFFAEYRVIHKDGHLVYILDHAVPYLTCDGQVVSLDGIIIDMSDKVKLQDHVLQSQGMKTLNEISARLAHEIRNPLVSAGGFARLLLTQMNSDDPNRAKAEIILKEVGRLEMILHMLLNYIKPLDLQICSVNLNVMLGGILQLLEPEIMSKNIHLDARLTHGIATISVDQQQMERAFEAILRNALSQCTSHGSLSIATIQQGKSLMICIRYPVEHLSADDIEHFFYPFTSFASYQTITDLPLSKIIINKHGGETEVKLGRNGELSVEVVLPLRT